MTVELRTIIELIAVAVAISLVIWNKLNHSKRDDNAVKRDDAETNLVQAQNSAAIKFIQDLIDDHRRLLAQLADTERERINNAQRIGQLTTEVNLLRDQIVEVKTLLQKLTKDLEDARRKIVENEGTIIRLEAERDLALAQLSSREMENKVLKKSS